MFEHDPIQLSREIAQVAEDSFGWQLGLKDDAQDFDNPFEEARTLLSKTRFIELSEMPDADPMRRPLLRWVHKLLERRVNHAWLTQAARLRYQQKYPVKAAKATSATLHEMLLGTLTEQAAAWYSALEEHAVELSAAEAMLWQRRQQIAVELGAESPDEWELPCAESALLADEWLDDFRAELEEFERGRVVDSSAMGLGIGAELGLPARLNPQAISDWFRGTRLLDDLKIRTWPLPQPLSPSSYMRALDELGAEFAYASAPRNQPFVIAHDPQRFTDYTHGACFALLLLNPAFLRVRLDVGRDSSRDTLRAFARCALLEIARRALKVQLRGPALQGEKPFRQHFTELVGYRLGADVSPSLAGVWLRLSNDDAQRFFAVALAARRVASLVEAHDEDWFRNPRAIEQLRSEAELPPRDSVEPDEVRESFGALRTLLAPLL